MTMPHEIRALAAALAAIGALAACSPAAPPATNSAPASAPQATATGNQPASAVTVDATIVAGLDPRFNPTAAAGGGINASNAVSADDVAAALKSIPQASQLKVTANSSPPGARGADVQSVSIIAQDSSGLLKGLDETGKRGLGEALLTASGAAWPNAAVSMLISDAAGAGGQIIGNRTPGGPNTLFVS